MRVLRHVSGERTAEVVLEERDVSRSSTAGRCSRVTSCVVPREHVVTLADLPAELIDRCSRAAQRCAAAMPEAVGAQGSWVSINNVVSQSVPHLHVHVVPRTRATGCAASSGPAPRTPTRRRWRTTALASAARA